MAGLWFPSFSPSLLHSQRRNSLLYRCFLWHTVISHGVSSSLNSLIYLTNLDLVIGVNIWLIEGGRGLCSLFMKNRFYFWLSISNLEIWNPTCSSEHFLWASHCHSEHLGFCSILDFGFSDWGYLIHILEVARSLLIRGWFLPTHQRALPWECASFRRELWEAGSLFLFLLFFLPLILHHHLAFS